MIYANTLGINFQYVTIMSDNIEIVTDSCKLSLHRHSIKGMIRDYIVKFFDQETNIESVIQKSSDIFKKLMDFFKDKRVKGRIIAKVEFVKLMDEDVSETYHFGSYGAEWINDTDMFFQRHMCKIASRLEDFNERGSNWIIKEIRDIYVQLTIF